MQSKPKANSVITHEVNGDVILFHVAGAGTLTLDLSKVHADNVQRGAVHGFIQRVSDGAAMSRDPVTGKPATAADKAARMAAIIAHYESGAAEWSMRGQGTGDTGGLLFRALVRYLVADEGASDEDARKRARQFMDALNADEKKKMLFSSRIKPHADAIRAEAMPDADEKAEELLAGL